MTLQETKEINKSIKSLDPRVKKAIDFAYNRIFKFHSQQKINNITYLTITYIKQRD